MQTQNESVFNRLNSVNVNDDTEKKSNLTYLPWASAWAEVKKLYPDATYSVHTDKDGLPYLFDEKTGYMVFTSVEINGLKHPMWLPVMDGANKAMKHMSYEYEGWEWVQGKKSKVSKVVEAASMFDINKAIMRCLVKNIAMHGLGLYIYEKEDAPEGETTTAQLSNSKTVAAPPPSSKSPASDKPSLEIENTEQWTGAIKYIRDNKKNGEEKVFAQIKRKYTLSVDSEKKLKEVFNESN